MFKLNSFALFTYKT